MSISLNTMRQHAGVAASLAPELSPTPPPHPSPRSQVIRKYLTSHTAYGDTGVRDDRLQMDNVPLGLFDCY